MTLASAFCHGVRLFGVTAMALLAVVATSLATRPVRATVYDYTAGHADIGLAYDAGTGPRFFLQFGGDAEASGLTNEELIAGQPGGVVGEWSLASFVTVVPQSVQIPRPAGAEWNFLGTDAGDPVWIFSQQSQGGVPFLGFDTAKAGGGTGTYTLSNVTVRPPNGEVSLFQIDGLGMPDAVYWSTAQAGVDAVTVPALTHVHYAFGFTKPGYYELPLIGTGGGFPGQATGTLAFQLVPEPSTYLLTLAGLGAAGLAARRRRAPKQASGPAISGV
ncbi:MAG: PEP-CTERM sorting domain-containing protein [Planctomycetes bacterium]|nr:PEP-CTERM sorting domain-containing protein [Planctomycetota bacterium]